MTPPHPPPSYATAPQSLAQTDGGIYRVSVEITTHLIPGERYCAALAASNGTTTGGSGSPTPSTGVLINFTAGIAPTASTTSVVDQTASQSLVSGTINPEGQITTYHIAYDTVDSTWCVSGSGDPADTTADQTVNSPANVLDTQDQGVRVAITGLQGGQTYCAAVVATNRTGTVTAPTVQFVAGMPSASASTATTVSPTAETLTGTVIPTTQATNYYAAYDFIGSDWCATGGDLSSPSFTTLPVALGGVLATDPLEVSVTVPGLTPGAGYCVELVAINSSGPAPSSPLSFTAGFPFSVTTSAIDHLTDSSVTIDGTVNPAGLATSYWVTYDTMHSDWCFSGGQNGAPRMATDRVSLAATDTADHDVTVAVNGLNPETAYCAEVVAQNDMGTTKGAQVSFTTAVAPVITAPVVPVSLTGAPSAALVNPSATSPTTATVTGTIGPGGQRTIYHAAYGPAGSSFCLSGGANGQPSTTAPVTLPYTDSNPHAIAVSLSGLRRATRYCAQIIAQNTSGVAVSAVAGFTTIGGPRLSGLRLAPATFVATKRGATSVAKLPKGYGTRVSYQDTQAGKVVFTVTRQHQGARTTHGACGPRRRNSLELCVYTTIIGHFTATAAAGANSLVFTGQLGGHKLAHGSYRLEAVAADRWQLSSPTATVRFAIR